MAAIGNLYPAPRAAGGPRSHFPLRLDSGPAQEMKMPVAAGFIPGRHGAKTGRVRRATPAILCHLWGTDAREILTLRRDQNLKPNVEPENP